MCNDIWFNIMFIVAYLKKKEKSDSQEREFKM